MSITITCQSRINSFFGKFFDGNKLAIRLNKKYVSKLVARKPSNWKFLKKILYLATIFSIFLTLEFLTVTKFN